MKKLLVIMVIGASLVIFADGTLLGLSLCAGDLPVGTTWIFIALWILVGLRTTGWSMYLIGNYKFHKRYKIKVEINDNT